MRVIPIGATLLKFELVNERLTRFYALEANTGHTIHLIRQDNPMPMNGGSYFESVYYPDGDLITLT